MLLHTPARAVVAAAARNRATARESKAFLTHLFSKLGSGLLPFTSESRPIDLSRESVGSKGNWSFNLFHFLVSDLCASHAG